MVWFNLTEFDSPDLLGSGQFMDREFLARLEVARYNAGVPFRISSGYRTKAHNKEVGGVPKSLHLKGLAADILYKDQEEAIKIIVGLSEAGMSFIKLYDHHIHCELRK